ncbi:hypothetical protein C0J50_23036 [Silurus asotus]|uniref:Uncharacterized protein n=1 Tax=Silurus asotus TaxID=30991 RepID=A0AAD5AKL9_SILAS|nr:hypothetical protein C0J50_23036 [Silurus asotus]
MKPRSLDRKSLKPQERELGAEKDLVNEDTTETTETMTEERQAPKGICLLQSMLNRIKSSEKLQDPSHVTAQHCRHGVDTNQCDDLLIAELDKPKRNFEEPDHSECSDKPELEYFTYRTVVHEKQSCWRENTNLECEPTARRTSLIHTLRKKRHGVTMTFTLNDFRLDLEPINLLEEVCTGDEWARFLPVINPSAHPDAKDDSQREDSHNSSDDIGPCNAVIKLARSADKEQSEISSSLVSVTDSQIDSVIQTRQETSPKESPFSDLPKTPQKGFAVAQMPDLLEYEQLQENYFMVVYVHDKTDLTKVKDLPLDLSVVKPLVTNTASLQMISEVTESYSNDHDFAEKTVLSKNDQLSIEAKLMDVHHDLSYVQTSVRNAAALSTILKVPECSSNDNDKPQLRDVPYDFSLVKSSELLEDSVLKYRISLGKKRKHRPPGKKKRWPENDHADITTCTEAFIYKVS